MRRAIAIGLIGFGLMLLSARPASAQYGWFRWIQELSGPGPLQLQGVTVTFGCAREGTSAGQEGHAHLFRYVFCDTNYDWQTMKRYFGVTIMYGDGENNLVFPDDREKLDRVKTSLYLFSGTFRTTNPGLDVGSAIGFTRFTGTPGITVTKFIINPFVAVRPVGLFLKGRNVPLKDRKANRVADFFARAVEFNAGLIVLPQGFHLSDFGAIGGPDWTGDPEFNGQIGLKFRIVY